MIGPSFLRGLPLLQNVFGFVAMEGLRAGYAKIVEGSWVVLSARGRGRGDGVERLTGEGFSVGERGCAMRARHHVDMGCSCAGLSVRNKRTIEFPRVSARKADQSRRNGSGALRLVARLVLSWPRLVGRGRQVALQVEEIAADFSDSGYSDLAVDAPAMAIMTHDIGNLLGDQARDGACRAQGENFLLCFAPRTGPRREILGGSRGRRVCRDDDRVLGSLVRSGPAYRGAAPASR